MYLQFATCVLAGVCVIIALFGTMSGTKRLLLVGVAIQLAILSMYPLAVGSSFAAGAIDLLLSLLIVLAIVTLTLVWGLCVIFLRHRNKPWQLHTLTLVTASSMLALLLQSNPH